MRLCHPVGERDVRAAGEAGLCVYVQRGDPVTRQGGSLLCAFHVTSGSANPASKLARKTFVDEVVYGRRAGASGRWLAIDEHDTRLAEPTNAKLRVDARRTVENVPGFKIWRVGRVRR